ncbi:MAG: hypothetical protein KGL69_03170 [Alphaproteobacteria bacterium]|nr:hypothetical protein [Alphaproteobacteria bacterium]
MRPHRLGPRPRIALALILAGLVPAQALAAGCLRSAERDDLLGGLVGGGLGGLLGHAVNRRPGATALGAAGGAVVGVAVASQAAHCGQNAYGYYDETGRWMPYRATAGAYQGPDGRWIAGPTPGESAEAASDTPGSDPDETDAGVISASARDTRGQASAVQLRIVNLMADGTLDQRLGGKDLTALDGIRRLDAAYRDENDRLSPSQRADILQRLRDLSRTVDLQIRSRRARP